jgi:hypothetical protein
MADVAGPAMADVAEHAEPEPDVAEHAENTEPAPCSAISALALRLRRRNTEAAAVAAVAAAASSAMHASQSMPSLSGLQLRPGGQTASVGCAGWNNPRGTPTAQQPPPLRRGSGLRASSTGNLTRLVMNTSTSMSALERQEHEERARQYQERRTRERTLCETIRRNICTALNKTSPGTSSRASLDSLISVFCEQIALAEEADAVPAAADDAVPAAADDDASAVRFTVQSFATQLFRKSIEEIQYVDMYCDILCRFTDLPRTTQASNMIAVVVALAIAGSTTVPVLEGTGPAADATVHTCADDEDLHAAVRSCMSATHLLACLASHAQRHGNGRKGSSATAMARQCAAHIGTVVVRMAASCASGPHDALFVEQVVTVLKELHRCKMHVGTGHGLRDRTVGMSGPDVALLRGRMLDITKHYVPRRLQFLMMNLDPPSAAT